MEHRAFFNFGKLEDDLFDCAVESDCGDFEYSLNTGNYLINISVEVDSKVSTNNFGRKSLYRLYKVASVEILDEHDNDITSRYPRFVERMDSLVPDYDTVLDYIRDSSMSYEEMYFGSEQGYLDYRYG